MASRVLGVDSGGTFTDLVSWEDGEVRTHKRPSTPEDPSLAILAGIKEASLTQDTYSTRVTSTPISGQPAACFTLFPASWRKIFCESTGSTSPPLQSTSPHSCIVL